MQKRLHPSQSAAKIFRQQASTYGIVMVVMQNKKSSGDERKYNRNKFISCDLK